MAEPAVSLENCIEYWENELFHNKYLMSPSTQVLVESTLEHLKNYRAQLSSASKDTETGG